MTPEQRDSVKRAAAAYEAVLESRALAPIELDARTWSDLCAARIHFRSVRDAEAEMKVLNPTTNPNPEGTT